MFGYKIGLLLVLIVLFPLMPSIFADPILLDFDKTEYHTGDNMIITGHISNYKMPIIAMSLFDPEGDILSANNLIINSNGTFSKAFSLDSPFYDKSGQYTVKLNYGKIVQNEFFTIVGNTSEPEIAIPESIIPEIISINTDKNQYYDQNFITITGSVNTIDSPTVLIGVHDPYGTPIGFYFGEINSSLQFSTKFLVKSGVNFKVDGTYQVKAHYGESEKTINFEFSKKLDTVEPEIKTPEIKTPEIKTPEIKTPEIKTPEIKTPEIKTPEIKTSEKNINSVDYQPQIKKYDNLSVEDIELGKLLNQINLDCDHSRFIDTISYNDGMGPALYRLCKFDQSLSFFNDSLSKDPNNVEIITSKGSVLGKMGRTLESISYYDTALNIDPNFIPAINNKANALANMKKYDESISLYNKALEKNPSYDTARKNLQLVLQESSLENKVIFTEYASTSTDVSSNIVSSKDTMTEKLQTENNLKTQTKNPTNIFEELSLVFSSLGSLFGFQN
ncbi:tetratricopeptide repeat protein [Nitrosarchaeum sp.]|uniref:tetratricopeptide repeat protein n=1 Tax=Nitrosarchaeum sp. TaxID=2026886 RepID=UPI002623A827|nr:tetratricopeptide repeat protein [Nitrosarchaeum sp.]